MKPIYIMALHGVRTGGPEAIHQLSDALISQGFDARIVYYDWPEIAKLEQVSPQDGYRFPTRTNEIEEYTHYKTNVACEIPNAEEVVVVLPETLCHLAPKFDRASVLVWWLSVDNGFGALSRVNLNHLRATNVRHAWQSKYAANFVVDAMGFWSAGSLTDYTTSLAGLTNRAAKEPKRVTFNANPHKVIFPKGWVDRLHEADPEIVITQLSGLSRAEVAEELARASVYVDLGSFPGKDRLPREAASLGCEVIVADVGAGKTDFNGSSAIAGFEAFIARTVGGKHWRVPYGWSPDAERNQFFAEALAVFSEL